LTWKIFIFQFVNSYSSLIYIAFFRANFGTCAKDDCLSELNSTLVGIFVINFLLNAVEIGLPWIKMKWKGYQERKAAKKNKLAEMDLIWAKALAIKSGNLEVSNTEEQAFKEAYDSPLEDYMEVVI